MPAASDKEAIQSTRRRHFVKKPPAIHKKPAAPAIHKKPAASHKKPSAIDNAIKYASKPSTKRKKKAQLEKDAKKRKNVTVRARLAAKKGVAYTPRAAEFRQVAVQARAAHLLAKVIYVLMEGPINFSIFLFGVSFVCIGLYWFVLGSHGRGSLGSPRDPMGGEPLGGQRIPWEGTLGSPRDPWEGTQGAQGIHGTGPSGAQGIPWEGTLGSPRDPDRRGPSGAHGIPWEGTQGSPLDPKGAHWIPIKTSTTQS